MKALSKPLRVAQIGVDNFGRARRELLRESGCFKLEAVSDWNQAAAQTAAKEEGCAVARSYEELLNTPGIEAVVISTGAKYHAEQIQMAAERGLHVFVEKPVCATPEEMQTLLDLERESGVVIAVGHNAHDQDGPSLFVKEMIESGELGTVATFQKTAAHNGGFHIKPGDWRGDRTKNPGGMLFQCGVHGIHELMFYFGPIVEVFASMRYDVHTTQTADVAICQLGFAGGLIGTLVACHVTPYRHSFSIFGTKANIYREERYFDEGTSISIQRGRMDGAKEVIEPVAGLPAADQLGNLKSFYRAIREGAPVSPSLQDGLRAVQVVFAAEESARLRAPVAIPALSASELGPRRNECVASLSLQGV